MDTTRFNDARKPPPRGTATRAALAAIAAAEAAAWLVSAFGPGRAKAAAWWLLLPLSAVGIAALVAATTKAIVRLCKRRAIGGELAALIIVAAIASWPALWPLGIARVPYPADRLRIGPSASVRLPLDGPIRVGWGGDTVEENYHVMVPMERWAYDLVADPANVGSRRLEDYGIFGARVVAPAGGTVAGCRGDAPDLVPGDVPGFRRLEDGLGNYVSIRLDETETYLVIAHLKRGSVGVSPGRRIAEGDFLALAGNSGSSSEPHVHIHHQRQDPGASLFLAEGLPLYFRDTDGPPMPTGGVAEKDGGAVAIGMTIRHIGDGKAGRDAPIVDTRSRP
ncbi:MAG: M23 family metallopeptidase [Spirochaetes bacterium]|nr:M23 family metallopeptidase [Spirochaetota bacterium]MBU1081870.1 M23 family metallopeptidase [Spirochaetota bacterium]